MELPRIVREFFYLPINCEKNASFYKPAEVNYFFELIN